jgi:hypothetical protein
MGRSPVSTSVGASSLAEVTLLYPAAVCLAVEQCKQLPGRLVLARVSPGPGPSVLTSQLETRRGKEE